ncbi:hypothetical protein OG337_00115 [[Kitasatospora] papulosa]|uniref:hypothetical protein n=1 Tax=Streptomyces TaxID=1883 RepID=UPI00131C8077|nr:hypothetical protein [Streptomyces flavovirens]WSZ45841.1 hypothetical protein OG337_00115 [[Kitasatospora] papulosa]
MGHLTRPEFAGVHLPRVVGPRIPQTGEAVRPGGCFGCSGGQTGLPYAAQDLNDRPLVIAGGRQRAQSPGQIQELADRLVLRPRVGRDRQPTVRDTDQPLNARSKAGLLLHDIRHVSGVDCGEQLVQRAPPLLAGLLEESRDFRVDLFLGGARSLEVLPGFLEERIQSGPAGRQDSLERPGPTVGLLEQLHGSAKVVQRPLAVSSQRREGSRSVGAVR